MSRRLPPLLALVLGALLVGAVPAGAVTTVSTSVADTVTLTNTTASIDFTGAISIDPMGAGSADDLLVVTGDTATGGGCTQRQAFPPIWVCPLTTRTKVVGTFTGNVATYRLSVDLDRPGVSMTGTFTASSIDGSATSDADLNLTGESTGPQVIVADSVLLGGGGDDTLSGRGGHDTLRGGPGDDAILPGDGAASPGVEIADGGEGTQDTISFADQTTPVNVSFDGAANDGAAGNPVQISGFENATGGSGNDTITGDGGFNQLRGLAGDDTVDGAGGGHDVLRGDLGNDTVRARDAVPAFGDVACGPGADSAILDVLDVVAPDCETVDRAAAPPGFVAPGTTPAGGAAGDRTAPAVRVLGLAARVRRTALRRGLTFRVAVDEPASLVAELVVTARTARASALRDNLVAGRVTAGRAGGTRKLRLKGTAALLAGATRAAVRVTATDAAGNRRVVVRRLSLR